MSKACNIIESAITTALTVITYAIIVLVFIAILKALIGFIL